MPISDCDATNTNLRTREVPQGHMTLSMSSCARAWRSGLLTSLLVVALGASACGDDSSEPAGQSGTSGTSGTSGSSGSSGSSGAGGTAGSGGTSGAAGTGGTGLEVLPGIFTDINQPLDMVNEGDDIPLDPAPQGGHVIHVGAQVRGLTGDTVEIRGRLRETVGGLIIAEEARTVVMRPVPGDPTLMQTDLETISQLSHVPVCPDYDARDVVNMPSVLEVTVTELYTDPPRIGVATRQVTPRCNTGNAALDEACTCECTGNYTLGKCSGVPGNKG